MVTTAWTAHHLAYAVALLNLCPTLGLPARPQDTPPHVQKAIAAVTILLLRKPPDPVCLTHLALISKAYRPFTRRFVRWHARYHPGKTRAYGKIAQYNKATYAPRVP